MEQFSYQPSQEEMILAELELLSDDAISEILRAGEGDRSPEAYLRFQTALSVKMLRELEKEEE